MNVHGVLSRLRAVKQTGNARWEALCPAHEADGGSHKPSLSISVGEGGRTLMHCLAGCSTSAVLGKIGLREADLFDDSHKAKPGKPAERKQVAEYDYRDAGGNLLFQVVRFEPKGFRQRRPDGTGDWTWSLGDVRRVLYRLPELLAADPAQWVFIAEGEKDVDNLMNIGLTATTNPGGSMKWARLSDDSALAGRRVCIIADKDDPGRRHAADVARRLYGKATEVKVLELPGDGVKDASDWAAEFRDAADEETLRAELLAMTDAAPAGIPDDLPDGDEAPAIVQPAFLTPAELLTRFPSQEEEIIFGLLRRGEVGNLVSAPKMNKSWLLMHLGLSVALGADFLTFRTRPGRVLLLDYELAAGTLAKRLASVMAHLRITPAQVDDNLAIEPLRAKRLDIDALAGYFHALPAGRFDMVILDPLFEIFPRDMDENSNTALAEVYRTLRLYAKQLHAAIVVCHHLSKGSQADKSITDLGAGAGSQSRAADCHLAIRPHAKDDAGVLSGVVRSFPPFEPFAIRWRFPLWELAPDLDPEDLRRAGKRTRPAKEPVEAEPPKAPYDVQRFAADFLTGEPQWRDAILSAAKRGGVSNQHLAGTLLCEAEAVGLAHRWKLPKDTRGYYANQKQPRLDASETNKQTKNPPVPP